MNYPSGEQIAGGATLESACVVIDTNIWRATKLLRTPVGAALLFVLDRTDTPLVFPEVVAREVAKHGVALGAEARDKIYGSLGEIRALTGSAPEVTLPTDDELTEAVEGRIQSLEKYLSRVPFSAGIALRALDRVNARQPPSHAGQQYKDSAIWEHVLELGQVYSQVHLITEDKAFFRGKNYDGLENRLQGECESLGIQVTVHRSLASCLEAIVPDEAAFDPEVIVDAVAEDVCGELQKTVEKAGYLLAGRQESRLEAFVTEDPNRLAVEFTLGYEVESSEGVAGHASVKGQCLFELSDQTPADMTLSRIEVEHPDGGHQHVFLRAASVSIGGPRRRHYQVREPLPGGGEFIVSSTPAPEVTTQDEDH